MRQLFNRLFLRADQHHHLPAFHPRELLDYPDFSQIRPDALEKTHAELLMRHFPAAEAQGYFALVSLEQETRKVSQLDLIIRIVGVGPKLDLFDLDLFQLQTGFVLLLCLAVLELAEIHDPAYRGLGSRRDLHKIDFRRFRSRHCITRSHDTNLLTVNTNQTNLGDGDFLVDSQVFISQCSSFRT